LYPEVFFFVSFVLFVVNKINCCQNDTPLKLKAVDNLFGTIRMHKTKESIDVVAVNWVSFTNAV
jgi:hypothetical protein